MIVRLSIPCIYQFQNNNSYNTKYNSGLYSSISYYFFRTQTAASPNISHHSIFHCQNTSCCNLRPQSCQARLQKKTPFRLRCCSYKLSFKPKLQLCWEKRLPEFQLVQLQVKTPPDHAHDPSVGPSNPPIHTLSPLSKPKHNLYQYQRTHTIDFTANDPRLLL